MPLESRVRSFEIRIRTLSDMKTVATVNKSPIEPESRCNTGVIPIGWRLYRCQEMLLLASIGPLLHLDLSR